MVNKELNSPQLELPRLAKMLPHSLASANVDRTVLFGRRSPVMFLIWIMGGLLIAYLFVDLISWEEGKIALNTVGPICLGLSCCWTGIKLFTVNIGVIWLPVPWLLCSSALFFGLGPLIYFFGSEDTVAYMDQLYPVGPNELFRTTQLNIVGILCILSSFLVMSRLLRLDRLSSFQGKAIDQQSDGAAITKVVVVIFLLIGLPFRYLLVLPYYFGVLGFVLPGSIAMLDQLNLLSLFLLGYISCRAGRGWILLFATLLVCHTVTAFAQFGKEALILAIMMSGLGLYFGTRRISVFISTVIVVLVVYVWVTPLVTYGRVTIFSQSGETHQASLSERLSIAAEAIVLQFNDELPEEKGSKQAWWLRLSYVNVESFAMLLYDSGNPGYSFDNLHYYFIPRILYPDKPIMTDVGKDISEMAVGHRSSSTGLTVFGDLYWHGGWPFVVVGCFFIGILFAWISRLALKMLVSSDWLLLPCSVIGIFLALRIDGWFVQAYVGSLLIFLVYLIGIAWLRPWVLSVAASLQPRPEAIHGR